MHGSGHQLSLAGAHAFPTLELIEILRECGYLPTGPGFGTVRLIEIPDGLNAPDLETYLREHGAEICGCASAA